jgi:hypothetical protein
MQRIIVLTIAYRFAIGIQRLVVIAGTERRFELPPFVLRLSEKEADDRPGSGNAIAFEELEQTRNSFARAQQISPIRAIRRFMIANSPVELKIEGNYKGSIARPGCS